MTRVGKSVLAPPDAGRLRELLRLPPHDVPAAGCWVLCIGSASGRVAAALAGDVGHVVVAKARASSLRQAPAGGGHVLRACVRRLPFADGALHRIVVDGFEHLSGEHETLAELLRVLRAGGRLLIAGPDVDAFRARVIALAQRLGLARGGWPDVEELTRELRTLGCYPWVHRDAAAYWVGVDKPGPHLVNSMTTPLDD